MTFKQFLKMKLCTVFKGNAMCVLSNMKWFNLVNIAAFLYTVTSVPGLQPATTVNVLYDYSSDCSWD